MLYFLLLSILIIKNNYLKSFICQKYFGETLLVSKLSFYLHSSHLLSYFLKIQFLHNFSVNKDKLQMTVYMDDIVIKKYAYWTHY